MKHAISLKQYRGMDIFFFTSILCICEMLIILAATRWFPAQPYALSLTPAIVAMVLMRWGGYALIPAAAGGLVFCLLSHAGAAHYVIYLLGNLSSVVMVFFIRRVGWKNIRDNTLLCMLYGLLTALCMQLSRAVIALLFFTGPIGALGFITTDVLSTLFSVLLCWIMRRIDGMLEDQVHYIDRIQKQEQSKGV